MKFEKIFVSDVTEVKEFNKRFSYIQKRIKDVFRIFKESSKEIQALDIYKDYDRMREVFYQLFPEDFQRILLRELEALEVLYPYVYKENLKHGYYGAFARFFIPKKKELNFVQYLDTYKDRLTMEKFNFGADMGNSLMDIQDIFTFNS